jgi:oligoribonuclease NrnB/cAMP/cGMP phosphodiesterase (DHH superfamily)
MVYIVDFSFVPEVMKRVLQRTKNVIWCDHHSTAKAYDYGVVLPGLRDFMEPSRFSGAALTWKWLTVGEEMPSAVQLVSDYDTWRHAMPSSVKFMEGLKMRPHGPEDEIWQELFEPDPVTEYTLDEIIAKGATVIEYRDIYCAEMRKAFGYECEFEGHRCYALNCYRFGSLMFGELIQKYAMCIAFAYDGEKTTVSVYSTRQEIHAGEICRKFGGGGHKGAAGFIVPGEQMLPWNKVG